MVDSASCQSNSCTDKKSVSSHRRMAVEHDPLLFNSTYPRCVLLGRRAGLKICLLNHVEEAHASVTTRIKNGRVLVPYMYMAVEQDSFPWIYNNKCPMAQMLTQRVYLLAMKHCIGVNLFQTILSYSFCCLHFVC